eukprot:186521-Alexandrium_andersonii.AAC.1
MKDVAAHFDNQEELTRFGETLTEMWSTWGGREPPREPDTSMKLKAPFEGSRKKIFHEQDFVRFDID